MVSVVAAFIFKDLIFRYNQGLRIPSDENSG